jgi:uncharacterized protein YcbK (DUF882 family)
MPLRTGNADLVAAIAVATACVALFASGVTAEPRVCHTSGLASKKGGQAEEAALGPPLLGTLVQTHTDERIPLDRLSPTSARFDALLADRATGTTAPLDPRLLGLLRTVAEHFASASASPDQEGGAPRIELVSGFRSPKLNEMLRKKGHHVASHSQHSLGHAVDFRIVVPCAGATARTPECAGATSLALHPRVIERAIRGAGWEGGTGIYTLKEDWFVHADVGPDRTWFEGPRGAETAGMGRTDER